MNKDGPCIKGSQSLAKGLMQNKATHNNKTSEQGA